MPQRKSDVPIVARRWGNAHGAKGGTDGRPFDGNVTHTQRWSDGDNGSRADSQSGSPGTAHAIHVAVYASSYVGNGIGEAYTGR